MGLNYPYLWGAVKLEFQMWEFYRISQILGDSLRTDEYPHIAKSMPRKRSPSGLSSFSISEAGRILGVSDTTLRHWTDDGKIRASVTPGGHRRYSESELRRFMGSHQAIRGTKDLAAELEDTVSHHREIAQVGLGLTSGYAKLSKESLKLTWQDAAGDCSTW